LLCEKTGAIVATGDTRSYGSLADEIMLKLYTGQNIHIFMAFD